MNRKTLIGAIGLLAVMLMGIAVMAATIPAELTRPDGKPPDMKKPVKVFILMGQSNMVGMGNISGSQGGGWGSLLLKPVLSVYEGAYSPTADYDKMTPVSTMELQVNGEWKAPDSPQTSTCVVRGEIQMKTAALCEFSPGREGSAYNIMVIAGTEVYRCEVGKEPVRKPFAFEAGNVYPFKVTYLTSDINNAGGYTRIDVPGALETLVKRQKKYPFLIDDKSQWTVRKDVYYYDARTKQGSPLSPTSNNGASIGPELGFGYVMGQILNEPVLVLKSCIGNRSLGWDLLPPGSKRFEEGGKVYAGYKERPAVWDADPAKGVATDPPPWLDKNGKPVEWWAGLQYDSDMADAKAALADLAKIYPGYQGQGYEIAGFVYWQGHKDQSAVYASHYEQNLVNLIKSLRKDYNAPNARFALAVGCGNPGRAGFGLQIAEAQLAMNDTKKYPEFAGNVKCVDSRDFWREVAVSPADQGYHYNRNAETYMEVGLSLGWAMADLLKGAKAPAVNKPNVTPDKKPNVTTDKKPEPGTALTQDDKKLMAKYAGLLKDLQAKITKALPAVDEQKKAAYLKAREAEKAAEAAVNKTRQSLNEIGGARALVAHAKGKWIGGAEEGIAQAEAALQKAATDADREAARKELAKWQADKEAGIQALKDREEALAKVQVEEPKLLADLKAGQEALAKAQAKTMQAVDALGLNSFLASDKLDAQLVKYVVLFEATPQGLAEFAKQGKEQQALVEKLLADGGLMKQMVLADGAKDGKYGQAMEIYTAIQKASPKAKAGVLQRLALGISLVHAAPVVQNNPKEPTNAPATVDPVKRYLHYEKAFLEGELDPAFKDRTAWECRYIIDGSDPDNILAWGREMLRNYRPDHIYTADNSSRYVEAVGTDVAYGSENVKYDWPTLQGNQNIIMNGGVCGRRAYFGRFILRSFGIPTVARPQEAHASLARWTPEGWVINLGGGWGTGWVGDKSDLDFLATTQARAVGEPYLQVKRAQWIGDVLGEKRAIGFSSDVSGIWSGVALYRQRAIIEQGKAKTLAAVGANPGKANESAETRAQAVMKAAVKDADKQVTVAPNGVITIPSAACSGNLRQMKSFLGGMQAFCGGAFSCEVNAPNPGKYRLTARVVSVHDKGQLQLTANNIKDPSAIAIPYTCGEWETTRPAEVTLVQGKNVLGFSIPGRGFTIKDFTLTPVK